MAIFIPSVPLSGMKCISVSHLHLSLVTSCLLGQCLYLLGFWVLFCEKDAKNLFPKLSQTYLESSDIYSLCWFSPTPFPSISLFILALPAPFPLISLPFREDWGEQEVTCWISYSIGTWEGFGTPWQHD